MNLDSNYQRFIKDHRFLKDHYRELLANAKAKYEAAAATGVDNAPVNLSLAEQDAHLCEYLSTLEPDDPRRKAQPRSCRFARWIAGAKG
jgi:hypothetical protein